MRNAGQLWNWDTHRIGLLLEHIGHQLQSIQHGVGIKKISEQNKSGS